MNIVYFKSVCNSPYFSAIAQAWSDGIEERIISKEGGYTLNSTNQVIVALDNDVNILGFIVFEEMVNSEHVDYLWIDFAHVFEEYRREGIFRKLLETLQIKFNGTSTYIELGTASNNYKMIKACERLDFKQESITMRLDI